MNIPPSCPPLTGGYRGHVCALSVGGGLRVGGGQVGAWRERDGGEGLGGGGMKKNKINVLGALRVRGGARSYFFVSLICIRHFGSNDPPTLAVKWNDSSGNNEIR